MKKRAHIYKKISMILASAMIINSLPLSIFAEGNINSNIVLEQENDNTENTKEESEAYIQNYDRPEGITWKALTDSGTVDAADGFLSITNKGDYRFLENESLSLEDGELECKFQISEEHSGRFGVLFRANENNHAGVAYDSNGTWVIFSKDAWKTFKGPELQPGDEDILKVRFIGNHITIDINGENYFDEVVDIVPVQEGKAGYRSWYNSKTTKVDYIKYGPVGSLNDGQTPEINIESIQEVNVYTFKRMKPELPSRVKVSYDNGATGNANVAWDYIDPKLYAEAGNFVVEGSISGTDIKAKANIEVKDSGLVYQQDLSIVENQGWKTTKGGGAVSYNGNSVTVGMNGVSVAVDEKSPNLKDFIYETDFMTTNDDGRIGLAFRYTSPDDFGTICYDNGSWIWKSYINGKEQYGSFGGSSIKIEKNKTYKLKLKAQDSNVSLYINDELVGTQAISNLPSNAGKIGLHGWYGSKNVTLSNIRVEEVLPLLPLEVGETKEQVIEYDKMKVVLDNNFPRVIRWIYFNWRR